MRGDLAFRDMGRPLRDLQDGSLTGVAAGRDLEDVFQGGFARSRVDRARHRDHPGAGGQVEHRRLDAAAPTSVSRLRTTCYRPISGGSASKWHRLSVARYRSI